MTAALITPPAVEPVLLAEAKAHLRVTATDDDALITSLILAARIHVERLTRRVLITQGWRIYLDRWPAEGVLGLPVAPVISVTAITVYDRLGAPSVIPASDYVVDRAGEPARIRLAATGAAGAGRALNGIEVDISAGYGPSGVDVPQPLRLAIMMLATRWYELRDGTFVGTVPANIADAFAALIDPYRRVHL